jgi:hypothetical protein
MGDVKNWDNMKSQIEAYVFCFFRSIITRISRLDMRAMMVQVGKEILRRCHLDTYDGNKENNNTPRSKNISDTFHNQLYYKRQALRTMAS